MKILHISCSPRGEAAESRRLSRKIVEHLRARDAAAVVVERVIGDGSLPHVDGNYATAQRFIPAEVHGDGSIATSELLIRELEDADVAVIGTPMHNLMAPSALKAWIDHVVRARRTFSLGPQGKAGTLHDRPVYIAISSGGRFSGERARQPDLFTPYLRLVLGNIGLHDLRFFTVEGTDLGEDVLVEERSRADNALREHFAQLVIPA